MCLGTDANQEILADQYRFVDSKPLANASLDPIPIYSSLAELFGNRHSQARVIPVVGIGQHLNALSAYQTTRTK